MAELRTNYNRNVVCVFKRGPQITHYVAVEGGPCLAVKQMPNDQFDDHYYNVPDSKYSPLDFAKSYIGSSIALKIVPVAPSALRVLRAIITGQASDSLPDNLNLETEDIMAKTTEAVGFRKPNGPVAQIHKFMDSKLEQIKAATVSRKELIDKLVEKGFSAGTATTQAGVWAGINGVSFVRPGVAADAKKAVRSKAAKKVVRKGTPGEKKVRAPRKPKTAEAAAAA